MIAAIVSQLSKKFICVAFDQRNHGSRLLSKTANMSWKEGNPNHQVDMWTLQYGTYNVVVRSSRVPNPLPFQKGTARDISYLIDVLPMFLKNSIKNWGVTGFSMGGHAAILAACHGKKVLNAPGYIFQLIPSCIIEPRLSVAVPIVGCGDYLTLLKGRAEHSGVVFPDPNSAADQQLIALLSTHDPVNAALNLKSRPLLILSGGKDPFVPAECNEAFIQKCNEVGGYYETLQQHFEVFVDAEAGHELTSAMKGKLVEWFEKYLH